MYTKNIHSAVENVRANTTSAVPPIGVKVAETVSATRNTNAIQPSLDVNDIRYVIDTNKYEKELRFARIKQVSLISAPSVILLGSVQIVNILFVGSSILTSSIVGGIVATITYALLTPSGQQIKTMKENIVQYEKMIEQLKGWYVMSGENHDSLIKKINELYPGLEQKYIDALLAEITGGSKS
ncbi:MAG: hypothetical protein LBK68_05505 [Candidatus Margulisbacteria bacterium]|jgi:hypothetical protein|nr:hypothetical protein [Candidatus Margulisiibacteriota bacterium]